MHAEQRPAVHGLEAVAHVGERAPDDHAHRVVDVVAAHLLFDGHVLQRAGNDLRLFWFEVLFGLFFVCHLCGSV